MLKQLTLIGLLLFSTQLLAQNSNEQWDLRRCIDYALSNNLSVKQAEIGKQNAAVNLSDSKFSRLPNLNANASYSASNGRTIDPFTNVIIDRGIQSQNLGLNSNLPIFSGFQIINSIRRDKTALLAAKNDLEASKNDVILNVVTFYTNVLFNQELLETANLRVESSREQLANIEAQVEAGALPVANLLQIKQQLANDELELVRAENNLNLSVLQLKQSLQLSASTPFEIVRPELPLPENSIGNTNIEQVYNYAVENQPIVKADRIRTESAEYGIKVAQSGYYPSLSLNAGISTAYSSAAPERFPEFGAENITVPIEVGQVTINNQTYSVFDETSVPGEFRENTYLNQLDFNRREFVSINLNIPIFNRFSVKNNVERARLNYLQRDYQLKQTKNQLQQTIEQAYYDVTAAEKSYLALLNTLETAEESYENAKARSEAGAINGVEFIQIKNDFERAKSDLVRAKFDYIFKIKILDFYQGKPLNF